MLILFELINLKQLEPDLSRGFLWQAINFEYF